MLYRVHPAWAGFELTTLVVTVTDCMVSLKSNYHTIVTTTTPDSTLGLWTTGLSSNIPCTRLNHHLTRKCMVLKSIVDISLTAFVKLWTPFMIWGIWYLSTWWPQIVNSLQLINLQCSISQIVDNPRLITFRYSMLNTHRMLEEIPSYECIIYLEFDWCQYISYNANYLHLYL
jgi:hypothetical protein